MYNQLIRLYLIQWKWITDLWDHKQNSRFGYSALCGSRPPRGVLRVFWGQGVSGLCLCIRKMTRYLVWLGRDHQVTPSRIKSRQVTQTPQVRQLQQNWPKKDIVAKWSPSHANSNGVGQFFHYLAKAAKADKAANSCQFTSEDPQFVAGTCILLIEQ